MSSIKYIPLFFLITLTLCQNSTSTSQTNSTKEEDIHITDEKDDYDIKVGNETLNDSFSDRQRQRPKYDKNRPFNMTDNEMDTMIFCTFVIQGSLQGKRNEIEKIQKRMNLTSPNQVYEKVGTDMFEKCNLLVDIKIVNKFVKNLTYFDNFKMDKSFNIYCDVDFDKYNNITDLSLTMEQQILMYKYQSVEEVFRQKRADQREEYEQEEKKIKIGSIEIDQIPNYVKFTAFLVVLLIIFGGIFYFLKTLEKKPKDKKKNKKKKTQ